MAGTSVIPVPGGGTFESLTEVVAEAGNKAAEKHWGVNDANDGYEWRDAGGGGASGNQPTTKFATPQTPHVVDPGTLSVATAALTVFEVDLTSYADNDVLFFAAEVGVNLVQVYPTSGQTLDGRVDGRVQLVWTRSSMMWIQKDADGNGWICYGDYYEA